ncbi:MAG: PKD domain-containing protein [Bacteroidetes bacterium]|nr:PKD domain-containing protein [Bacteroidota bacterium]
MKHIALFITAFFLVWGTSAQDRSNRGKEFWLGYGFNSFFFVQDQNGNLNGQELAIYISTEQAATVTVSINGTSWSQTLNIPANTADASIKIPKTGINDARILSDGLSTKGIHIVSDVPVAAYAHQYSTMFSAATMLMPVETWGYSYYSVNYSQRLGYSRLPSVSPLNWNWPNEYGWFFVIATEDNTKVEITPSDSTKNGWLPNQTYTVTLNKGEMYNVFGKANLPSGGEVSSADKASKDLTGSKIVSVQGADGNCHPVGVFSGSGGIRFCYNDGGEAMQQQIFPAQAWGTRYLTYHTINNGNTDINETNRNYYRICVLDPTTIVKRNGVVMTGLINNFYYETMDSTGGDYYEANRPILVAQYTPNKNQCWMEVGSPSPPPPRLGDPEMFILSPIEQGQKNVTLFASRNSSGIQYVYANIYLPTSAVASLRVDGVALAPSQIKPHPYLPSYSVAVAKFIGPAAPHNISCDSAFNALLYGLGLYESYGYNAGTNINNLNSYSAIQNTHNTSGNADSFTCPKTPVRLFVKVGFPATSITWKLSQVPGISPNTDSVIMSPVPVNTEIINGRTYYVYSLQQDFIFANPGTYTLPVTYTTSVTLACSQTEHADVTIVVKPGPVADFSITNAGCLKDTVTFTHTSIANGFTISNYLWNFDDGSTQTTIDAKKRFTTSGTQNIRYRIYADNGCAGDTTKTISILPEPVAKIGVTLPACDTVLISDTSAISSGNITTWKYWFGDGNTLTRTTNTPFTHVYATAGTYIIKLIAVSNNNCESDTAYTTVTVSGRPTAKFNIDKNVCFGDSIHFTDASTFINGTINSWHYDFGDGNSITLNNNNAFYHTYTTAGNFNVTLTVTSVAGCTSAVYQKTVIVANKPSTTVTYSGAPCTGSNITFNSSFANAPNTNWYWNFGDAQQQNTSVNNTTHPYTSAQNNVLVKLVVTAGGCASDTAFVTIPAIFPAPTASFSIKKDTVCQDKPVLFTSTLTGVKTWAWNFGNGTGAAVPPFSRAFSSAGNYNISLVITDANGCPSLPATDVLTVHVQPVVNAGADKIIQTGSSVLLDAAVTPNGTYQYLWTPSAGLNATNILQPVSSTANTIIYTLKVEDPLFHCIATDSVQVSVINKLFIPNTFTPNGDGMNDTWGMPGLALYPNAVVTIFNRYGERILESNNYLSHPWDGTYKGVQQPSGAYIYLIRLNDAQKQVLQGTITILR